MREDMLYNPGVFQLRSDMIDRYREIIQHNRQLQHCRLLFTGDSITQGLDTQRFFGDMGVVVNSGIAGITSQLLLHLIDECVLKFHPQVVIYMIGTNDLGATSMLSPKEIAQHIKAFCDIALRNIDTQILLLSPLPCDESLHGQSHTNHVLRSNLTLQSIFHEAKEIISHPQVEFLLTFEAFLLHGQTNTALLSDGLHLNDQGYQIYQRIIRSKLDSWLK
jgi:lysophospholipase L1-like esterase